MTGTRRRVSLIVAAIVAVLGCLLPAVPAQAAPTDETAVADARAFLAAFGADESTTERLISTYRAGGTWDSMSGESEPVSVDEFVEFDFDYTVSTYKDGSISVVREQLPEVGPGLARGISGCSASGTLRSNCKIDIWVGLVALSFYANYNLGNNTVSSVWGPGWSVGGACSVSLLSLSRPNGNMGRMDVAATICGVAYSTTFFLQLTVRSGAASVSWG